MHHPLESELMKLDTIIRSNTVPMNKTVTFLRMVTPRKQSLKVHAPVFFWTLYNRNHQKTLLTIVPASWAALLQRPTDRIRWYCSVMKRHFQRNLHPHAFNCTQNLLVNRSSFPAIASGSLSLLSCHHVPEMRKKMEALLACSVWWAQQSWSDPIQTIHHFWPAHSETGLLFN